MKKLFLIAALFFARPALAACSVSGGTAGFGNYDGSIALSSLGSISFNCSLLTSFTIKLGAGSGSISQRTMTLSGGTATVNYNLYTDALHTQIWGDGTTGASQSTFSIIGGFSISVFGLMPSGQKVTAGSYGDNVPVTIVF